MLWRPERAGDVSKWATGHKPVPVASRTLWSSFAKADSEDSGTAINVDEWTPDSSVDDLRDLRGKDLFCEWAAGDNVMNETLPHIAAALLR